MRDRIADASGGTAIPLAFAGVAGTCSMSQEPGLGAGTWAITSLALGVGLGLLHGVVWVALLYGPARAHGRWSDVVRATLAIGVGAWLVTSLGAFAKLGTRNHHLALVAIGGGIAVAALLFVVMRRFAVEAPPLRARAAVAIALALGAVVAFYVDLTVFVWEHRPAHDALRATQIAGLAFAGLLVIPWRASPKRGVQVLLAAVVFAALPFVQLHRAQMTRVLPYTMTSHALETLRALTDVDGDGFSGMLAGGDCAAFDPDVNPAAIEIADNGIDENCVDGDGTALLADLAAVPIPTTPSERSVVLVTIETLRADHMGVYGYSRDTTPMIDAASRDARVYERAFTPGAWTSIAIGSLMRGVNARRITWAPYAETDKGRLVPAGEAPMLERDERGVQTFMLPVLGVPTLAELLRRRGMSTAAVVDDRFSELLDPSVGTDAGFEVFVDADAIVGRDPDDRVVDLALQTLAELPRDRSFFLWVHLFGPHSPNTVHADIPTFGDALADGYDHEIRFVDAQVGRLLEGAKTRDPEVAWIVTADHGEVLLPGDRMHGLDLSPEVIRVPLVVGGTTLPTGREHGVVSTLDIVPTILGVTGTPAPTWLDGRDLRQPALADRVVLVDTWHRRFDGALLLDQAAATDGKIAVVFDIARNGWGLADLNDPTKMPDAKASGAQRLQTALRSYLAAPPLRVAP